MAEHDPLVAAAAVTDLRPARVERRRRLLARAWAIATVCWSLVRTVLAWVLLGDYGLNPWEYLLVDLSTSLVLGQSLPRALADLADRRHRRALRWGAVTLVAYVVPDAYLFTSTERLPPITVAVVVSAIAVGLGSTVVAVVHRVRAARAGVVQWGA